MDWRRVVEESRAIIVEFLDRGVVPTLRTVYYALVSKELIPNTRSAYKTLSRKLVEARKSGFIEWSWIADETRQTVGGDWPYWDPDEYSETLVEEFWEKLNEFKYPYWMDQDYYLEVWLEKFALAKTFYNWLRDLNVVLVPSRGYSSWTFLHQAYERISQEAEDRDVVILYFGDFDPSGKDIERFLREALEWFGLEVEVKRVAVTQDQIAKYNLPHTPEEASEIAKLMRDPRFKSWPYGLYRVELDALLAYVPDEFERIVRESVEEYFDWETYEEVKEREEEDRERVRERVLELIRERMEDET